MTMMDNRPVVGGRLDDPMVSLTRTEIFEIEEWSVESPDDLRVVLESLIAKFEESRNRDQVLDASINVQLTVTSGSAYL